VAPDSCGGYPAPTSASLASEQAAREDYDAVLNCGERIWGAAVVSKDLKGNVTVEESDHAVAEAATGGAGVGFVLGLFAPPQDPLLHTHEGHHQQGDHRHRELRPAGAPDRAQGAHLHQLDPDGEHHGIEHPGGDVLEQPGQEQQDQASCRCTQQWAVRSAAQQVRKIGE